MERVVPRPVERPVGKRPEELNEGSPPGQAEHEKERDVYQGKERDGPPSMAQQEKDHENCRIELELDRRSETEHTQGHPAARNAIEEQNSKKGGSYVAVPPLDAEAHRVTVKKDRGHDKCGKCAPPRRLF